MTTKNNIHQLLEDFIEEERNTEPNPFLSTRIMAAIETKNKEQLRQVSPVWKTAVVAISLLVAVFSGIAAGSLYQSNKNATDVVLINDDSMENFELFTQMGNE